MKSHPKPVTLHFSIYNEPVNLFGSEQSNVHKQVRRFARFGTTVRIKKRKKTPIEERYF